MSTETNKTIVRQLVDAINTDNEAAFLATLAPDVVDHYAPPGLPPGSEGWNMNRKMFRTAFPDGHWHEETLVAEGDLVVGRYVLRGTHQSEFFGVPATGNSISVSNIHIMRIADGKIVEHWGHGDDMGLMRQLGAMA
ncbi:MAG: ester cyclase [Caldilineaceae bacterium]